MEQPRRVAPVALSRPHRRTKVKPTPRRECHAARRVRGFTLLELMIAMVVIAIVAAVAIPSYGDYVRRAARSDAQLALLDAAQHLERIYTECNSYVLRDASTDPPCTTAFSALPAALTRAPKEGRQRYTIVIQALAAQAYTLRAVPLESDACGSFQVLSNGVKTVVGASVPVEECWRR